MLEALRKAGMPEKPLGAVQEKPSIAVLPFDNLSPDPEQEYFSDGLSEELINKLAQVKDLHVTARTSSFSFKGKSVDMRTVGEKLGVAYLLEGSVRKSGDQLRITAQLIKAEEGYHLFSETYDRELTDIFAIQDEIAEAVTTALSVTLGVGEFNRPGMTGSIEAYDEYLRAYANYDTFNPDSILAAIDLFKRVLDIDPDFGLGWLHLSGAYSGAVRVLPPGQTLGFKDKEEEALERARAIAPDMSELLRVTAYEHYENSMWLEADRIYKQILDEQGHADSDANLDYGLLLMRAGRTSDALPYLQRAKNLNPLDPAIYAFLGVALFNLKRIDEALVEARLGQTLGGPDYGHIVTEYLVALEANDRTQAASIISPYDNLGGDYSLVEILRTEDTETALEKLKELSKRSDIPQAGRLYLLHIASLLGDPELAFKNFVESGAFNTPGIIWHPMHRGIWQLSAFKTYVRDIGLYDYWCDSGEWGDYCRPVGDDGFECD
jgi:TolB-like protein